MRPVSGGGGLRKTGSPLEVHIFPDLIQELTMADVVFVVTTIALFALVAFVAKGVAKL